MAHVREEQERIVAGYDFLKIRFVEEEHLLLTYWSGWLDTERGIKGCLHILGLVKELGVTRIMNDNSKVTGHSGTTEWLSEVWLPSLREAGVQYFAWVYSQEIFTQLQIDKAVDNSTGIGIRTFFSVDEACQWLLIQG